MDTQQSTDANESLTTGTHLQTHVTAIACIPQPYRGSQNTTPRKQNRVRIRFLSGAVATAGGCGSENTRVFHTRTFVFVCGSRAPVLHIISSLGQGVLGAREALLRPKIAVVAARCMAWSLG